VTIEGAECGVESLGKMGQGNQKGIDALVQMLNSGQLDDDTRWQVVEPRFRTRNCHTSIKREFSSTSELKQKQKKET